MNKKVAIVLCLVALVILTATIAVICCQRQHEKNGTYIIQNNDTTENLDTITTTTTLEIPRKQKNNILEETNEICQELIHEEQSTEGHRVKQYREEQLIGEWINGTRHELYRADGSGKKWDTSDDIMEDEAQTFVWSMTANRIEMLFPMELGVVVPRVRYISYIDSANMIQSNDYGEIVRYKRKDGKLEMVLN